MPSSASTPDDLHLARDARGTASFASRGPAGAAHFSVIAFRRGSAGTLVPGVAVDVSNGDLAWRQARAAALDHNNVGAVELRDGLLLAQFGEVDLTALPR